LQENNEKLLIENNNLKEHIEILKNFINLENDRFETKCRDILSVFFTPNQIEQILQPKKKIYKWTPEDISSAMTLRSISPKAYRYLRNKKSFPLPGKLKINISIFFKKKYINFMINNLKSNKCLYNNLKAFLHLEHGLQHLLLNRVF